jgi:hypothetical protein
LLHSTGPLVVLAAAEVAAPPADVALLAAALPFVPVAALLAALAPPEPFVPALVPVAAFPSFVVFAGGGLDVLELQAASDSVPTSTEVPDRIFASVMDKNGCAWCSKPAKLQKSNRHANPAKA